MGVSARPGPASLGDASSAALLGTKAGGPSLRLGAKVGGASLRPGAGAVAVGAELRGIAPGDQRTGEQGLRQGWSVGDRRRERGRERSTSVPTPPVGRHSRQRRHRISAANASMSEANAGPASGLAVTICGGGNAAHVAAAMYSHRGARVSMFLSLEQEAQQWQEAAVKTGIELHKKQNGETYVGHIAAATTDPAAVVPDADLVLVIVPAFAHRPILTAIAPHLKPGVIILAMPAPGNFDLLARQVLGPRINEVVLAGSVCLPWACRIAEYARKVELLGEKSPVTIVARPYAAIGRVVEDADRLHDGSRFHGEKLFLEATLFPTNPMLHPGIMYAFWSRWDGTPLYSRPLFYEGVDDYAASILEGEDADLRATRRAMEAALGLPLTLPTLKEQMVDGYGDQIADPSTYKSMLATNSSLQGLYHPCVQDKDGKWGPDFKSRYLWEDIPHGLTAMKGVAQLMGVPTPTIDKVLIWAQTVMGREYLVGDQLVGKDVGSTSAPQAFGIETKEELLTELKHQQEAAAPGSPTAVAVTA